MKKVEFDFQVTDETYRESLDLEKLLNKRFFYGEGGLNVTIDHNLFIKKELADKLANEIIKLPLRESLGQEATELEKIALLLLLQSYGE